MIHSIQSRRTRERKGVGGDYNRVQSPRNGEEEKVAKTAVEVLKKALNVNTFH